MELANRFMKRAVYFKVGGYDLNYQWIGGEDFDISARIIKKGFKVGRINSFIYHHEVVSFSKMLKKYYYYGKYLFEYTKNFPQRAVMQFVFLRPAFIKNVNLLIKNPIYAIGLFSMKISQYFAGLIGLIEYLAREK
jgi:GT2 family glycosyltransferase